MMPGVIVGEEDKCSISSVLEPSTVDKPCINKKHCIKRGNWTHYSPAMHFNCAFLVAQLNATKWRWMYMYVQERRTIP